MPPLPELCRLLAHSSRGDVKRFFENLCGMLSELGELSFADLWREAAAENLTGISEMDGAALQQLGNSLGRYRILQQLNALSSCRRALCRSLEEAQQKLPSQLKLGLGLAVSVGILFWIVWI